MNSIREKKKEDYRLARVKKNLQDKEERLNAIRKGFNVLSSMRNSMKDIMEKTNNELKSEMDRLRHVSAFSPNRVVEKALQVSKEVLFPRYTPLSLFTVPALLVLTVDGGQAGKDLRVRE